MHSDILDGYDRIFLADIAQEQTRQRQHNMQSPSISRKDTKKKCIAKFKKYVEAKAEKMIINNELECLIHKDQRSPEHPTPHE